MNNKVVAMKDNKLDFIGWLVKKTVNVKFLNNIVLSILPKLTKEQALAVLKQANSSDAVLIFKHLRAELRNEKDFVFSVVKINGLALEFASDGLKNDKDVVFESVRNNPVALQYIGENLKNNKDEVKVIIQSISPKLVSRVNVLLLGSKEHNAFGNWMLSVLTLDQIKEIIARIKPEYVAQYFSLLNPIVKADKQFFLFIISKTDFSNVAKVMKLAGQDFRNDKDVILAAVKKNGLAMEFASDGLKNDKNIILVAANSSNYLQILELVKGETIKSNNDLAIVFADFVLSNSFGSRQVRIGSHKEENGSYTPETETHYTTIPYIVREPGQWQGDGTYREVDDFKTEYFIKDEVALMKILQEKLFLTEAEAKEMVVKANASRGVK